MKIMRPRGSKIFKATADNFTFSTKYPRMAKGGKKSGFNPKFKSIGLAIPSKFRLAKLPNTAPLNPKKSKFNSSSAAAASLSAAASFSPRDNIINSSFTENNHAVNSSKKFANALQTNLTSKMKLNSTRTSKTSNINNTASLSKSKLNYLKKVNDRVEKFSLVDTVSLQTSDAKVIDNIAIPSKIHRLWSHIKDLHPAVHDSIKKGLLFNHPSLVQYSFIQKALADASLPNILCGSQTGTGKTVAYLTTIFHLLKVQEDKVGEKVKDNVQDKVGEKVNPKEDMSSLSLNDNFLENNDPENNISNTMQDVKMGDKSELDSLRKWKRPRAIVLVPSRHLVFQITKVAKQMSHYCKLRVVGAHAKTKNTTTLFYAPIDILITTPTFLLDLIENNDFSLSFVERIVLDEADSLFDTNFVEETKKVLEKVFEIEQARKKTIPAYMFTATFPQTLNKALTKIFPEKGFLKLTTPTLHQTIKLVHHSFLHLNQSTTRENLLVETLKRAVGSTSRILVFCNTTASALKTFTYLRSKSYPVVLISSTREQKELEKDVLMFVEGLGTGEQESLVVAVATDMASRGLDTTLVGQVINFDFPTTSIDYMHRCGRAGRYGRKGRCTSIMNQREMDRGGSAIEEAVKRGLAVS